MRRATLEEAIEEGWYRPNTNNGFCMCMCGELAPIVKKTIRKRGQLKDYPMRYIVGHIPHTEESKRKIGLSKLGKPGPKHSLETRLKMSIGKRGDKCHLWKGGIGKKNKLARHTVEYKIWRELVFERDDWTCQVCNRRGGELHPHHIKPFAEFENLRTDINNGITLCAGRTKDTCHGLADYLTNIHAPTNREELLSLFRQV